MTPSSWRAEGLAAFRGERLVFRDVDFTLPAGGAMTLEGPNGAGKSTLLRLLAGLLRPLAGRFWRDEVDALAEPTEHARHIAYLGHHDAIKPGLTVAENLRFHARLSGRPVAPALAAQGLEALTDLPARLLSAGQRRRLALARLGLTGASLWLLDEPTVGLDRDAIARFGVVLAEHRARGGTVVAATHVALPLDDVAILRLA